MKLAQIKKLAHTVARYDRIALRAYEECEEKFSPELRDRAASNDEKFSKSLDKLVALLKAEGVTVATLSEVEAKVDSNDEYGSVWQYVHEALSETL